MKIKLVSIVLLSLLLTGCSTIVGIEPRESVTVKPTMETTIIETEEETSSVSSGEGYIDEENNKSLGNISIGGDIDDSSRFGQLVAPTKPTEATTTQEYTTEEYTTQEAINLVETTTAYVEPETTARDWGDTPNMYSSAFGSPKYKTNVDVPDKSHLNKDSYGNYIIPYEMYSYRQQLPVNERGKIPYVFWYDEYGNILNPFPDELKDYAHLYELGMYEDENNMSHLIPTVPVS